MLKGFLDDKRVKRYRHRLEEKKKRWWTQRKRENVFTNTVKGKRLFIFLSSFIFGFIFYRFLLLELCLVETNSQTVTFDFSLPLTSDKEVDFVLNHKGKTLNLSDYLQSPARDDIISYESIRFFCSFFFLILQLSVFRAKYFFFFVLVYCFFVLFCFFN